MAFQKGHKTPGPGRPKGKLSKHTMAAKDAIEAAVHELGGHTRLVAWTKEDPQNERIFWGTIFPKLLPLQVTGNDGAPLVPATIQFIREPD